MANIRTVPDEAYKFESFKTLVDTAKKSGIPIDLKRPNDTRRDAIAFIIETIYETYAPLGNDHWKAVVNDLVNEIAMTSKQSENPASDVSWKLDRTFESLFRSKLETIAATTTDPKQRNYLDSLLKLNLTLVANHAKEHEQGIPVFFGGLPHDFIPSWCTSLE
jgi:hypothetical protein